MQSTTKSWNIYLRLLKVAAPYWLSFAIGLVGTILAAGTDSLLVWAIKPLIDNGLVKHDPVFLHRLPCIIIAIFLLRGFTYFLSNYYIVQVGRNVVRDFRQRVFAHLMHLPAKFYDRESSGKLLSMLVFNTEQIATATTEAVLVILQEGLAVIGLLAVAFMMSWQLTSLFLITVPLVSIIVRYNAKRLRLLSSNVQDTMGDVSHTAEEGIENYKVIRVFGGENYEITKFNTVTQKNRDREMKVITTNAVGSSLVQIAASLPFAAIIYIAMLPSLHISVGSFGAIVATLLRLLTPIRRLTKVNTEIQKGIAGAHSLFNFLDEKREDDIGRKNLSRAKGRIEYHHADFRYTDAGKQILHDVNFTVEPGETVALVGRSGSGKSTLVNLLPRFYDVTQGAILIDDVNINDYQLLDLRKQFAIVSQHLTLFNDTIANNIAYGCLRNIDMQKILAAAEAAHIMDFIKQLPAGLDTMIGENGLLLSGGQRQRIAIARALLKNAPILILDEATSSLDTESEHYIQAALSALMQQRTTLVIAHRLSTVEKADKIMVLDAGRIVETGKHAELLQQDGLYAKLYKMQFNEVEVAN